MPPSYIGWQPYGASVTPFFDPADDYGWPVTGSEEEPGFRPGLLSLAQPILSEIAALAAISIEASARAAGK
jgi:hypothetical protein